MLACKNPSILRIQSFIYIYRVVLLTNNYKRTELFIVADQCQSFEVMPCNKYLAYCRDGSYIVDNHLEVLRYGPLPCVLDSNCKESLCIYLNSVKIITIPLFKNFRLVGQNSCIRLDI